MPLQLLLLLVWCSWWSSDDVAECLTCVRLSCDGPLQSRWCPALCCLALQFTHAPFEPQGGPHFRNACDSEAADRLCLARPQSSPFFSSVTKRRASHSSQPHQCTSTSNIRPRRVCGDLRRGSSGRTFRWISLSGVQVENIAARGVCLQLPEKVRGVPVGTFFELGGVMLDYASPFLSWQGWNRRGDQPKLRQHFSYLQGQGRSPAGVRKSNDASESPLSD